MWLNIIGFNIVWFGLVMLGASFIPVALIWLAVHLYFNKQWVDELSFILKVSVIGIVIDSTLFALGFFQIPGASHIPFWLIVLWPCFAATLSHSLFFLASSRWLQWLVGTIFPALSYVAGVQLSEMNFAYPLWLSYLILALIWGPLMLLFFYVQSKVFNKESAHA